MSASYDAYRVFYHVATCGSLTMAARLLHNSQPNIPRIINQLERDLNCRLFTRSNKGVTLTREGETLYIHVREAVLHITCAEGELKNRSDRQTGQITIAASETALRGVLLPILSAYRREYPGVQIYLRSMTTEDAIESLKHRLADIAVVTKPMHEDSSLTAEQLAVFPDALIAPKAITPPRAGPLTLADLADWPFISMHLRSVSYAMLRDYFFRHGVLFQPGTYVSSLSQIVPMVASGLGAAFLPAFMAREQLSAGEIQQIPLADEPPAHAICMLYAESKALDASCAELVRRLRRFKAQAVPGERSDPA